MTEQQPQPERLTDEERKQRWLEIGKSNPWISEASDPPFTIKSFYKCDSLEEMQEALLDGPTWCLGQAFYYEDLCLIQQVEGGDEWLTIRHEVPFESISFRGVEDSEGRDAVRELLDDLMLATKEQCIGLDYAGLWRQQEGEA